MQLNSQYVLLGAAALVVLWPQIYAVVKKFRMPALIPPIAPAAPASSVSYQESMLALADVRKRLEQTGGLPEDAGHAIEVITHALVEGSGK